MSTIHSLVKTLLTAENEEEMQNLLQGLFTPAEIEEFGRRIEIVKMLKNGIAQRDIAAKLGVGVATVSRGSREIKEGNFKYVQ